MGGGIFFRIVKFGQYTIPEKLVAFPNVNC